MALDRFQLPGQLLNLLLDGRFCADALGHLLCEFPNGLAGFPHQLIPRLRFLFVGVEHLLFEDLIGQRGLDLVDAFSGKIGFPRLR